jgi:uncharacterized protein (TIGR03084 family)
MQTNNDVLQDLEDEQDRIEAILAGLDDAAWLSPSGAPGWTVADVVLHLAQTEEAVVASTSGADLAGALPASGNTMDELMDNLVALQRAEPAQVFARWQEARRAAVAALRAADTQTRLPWAAAPLRPAALATTRLAEHWAHGLDITGPLGIDYPDTDRLRHVAWLAHRSLPYGFALAGEPTHEIFCSLTAPDGATMWEYGDPAVESRIAGPAGAFCRVGAQRLPAQESGLETAGPYGALGLQVLRNYAG